MNWLDSISSSLLNKSLDGLWTRERAISDNMSNYETPGYKMKSVSFEDQLKTQLQNLNGTQQDASIANINSVSPVMTEAQDQTERADGNGVDLEQQFIDMSRTTLNYSYSLQQINDNFSRLRTAITGTVK